MYLSDLANIIDGKLIGDDKPINDFIIDGRKAHPDDCYIALIGTHLDGHHFIDQAILNGATSAIVSQVTNHAISLILVDDTTHALSKVAANHRQKFQCPVLALTGSCGKTTVKEMIKAILPSSAFVTPGNLNNHIGVPLSLLSLRKSHSHAIFELGANHIGEIATLASWAQPNVTLITNIAPAHLEGFGSIEGVAKAKGEIFNALTDSGTALINFDDKRVVEKSQSHQGKKISYSCQNKTADVTAQDITLQNNGNHQFQLSYQNHKITIYLKVPGKHNVSNALAAATAAISLNISLAEIKEGLEKFNGVDGRLTIKTGRNGSKIIDDSYNANLHSVKAAIDVLSNTKNERIFILGELAEAGNSLTEQYKEIGKYSKDKNIQYLFTCGSHSQNALQTFGSQGKHFNSQQSLLEFIHEKLNANTSILVKGSRSAHMENIINHLMAP